MPLLSLRSLLPVPPSFRVTSPASARASPAGEVSGRVTPTHRSLIPQQVVTRLGSVWSRAGSGVTSWGQDLCREAL